MSARRAALDVLLAVERGQTTLSAEIERARREVPDARDRALLLELAAGTLRWRASLDALITARGGQPVAALDPPIRNILRLSAFQIEHLSRVPGRAVVHEAVALARASTHEGAARFVNAVLRNLTRGGPDPRPGLPGPDAPRAQQIDYLSVTLSHPRWLAARWLDRHGFEAARAWCVFNNETPAIAVRPAPGFDAGTLLAALAGAGVVARRGRYATEAVILEAGALGRLTDAMRAAIIVQDEGSQIVAGTAAARAGPRVLDLCASPGGKTRLIAGAIEPGARLVASDHRRSRVRRLRETIGAARLDIPIVQLDARQPLPFGRVFSTVFVDAPCSGMGVVRRDPDVKWSRQESDLASFAAAQHEMLTRAADVVVAGGRLVYATCSSEPDENQAVVGRFLERPDFVLEPVAAPPGAAGPSVIDAQGCLATRPDLHGLDAFFAAVLVLREGA